MTRHFTDAMNADTSVMLSDTTAECKYASAKMLLAIEYLIYLANKSYIDRGIRRIPKELQTMKRLLQEFWTDYQQLIAANSQDDIRSCSTRFMKSVQAFFTTVNNEKRDHTEQYPRHP